jgi:hypothetical protein
MLTSSNTVERNATQPKRLQGTAACIRKAKINPNTQMTTVTFNYICCIK